MAVWVFCTTVLLLCCFVSVEAAPGEGEFVVELCDVEGAGAVRLDSGAIMNTTCGTVEGRVQICEDGWRYLCDSMWTLQDTAVACKSLNYSIEGAVIPQAGNIQTALGSSSYGVNCSGSESSITDCVRNMENNELNGQCEYAALVLCYTTNEEANNDVCGLQKDETATTTMEVPSTTVGSGVSTGGDTTNSKPLSNTEPTRDTPGTTTTTTTTEPNPPISTAASGILVPPTLYILIGGVCGGVVILLVLSLFCVLICCCCVRKKPVFPADAERQKNGGDQLHAEYMGESKVKDHTTATQYQLQSQPIYEAIPSTENSSAHSQGSPSSKPYATEQQDRTYATLDQEQNNTYAALDQSGIYAQVEPNISSPRSASLSAPNPGSYYQQLHHGTGSMKRELPSRPVQAMNPTALAIARGELEERDLLAGATVGGFSASLPINTGRLHQKPNGSGPPHRSEPPIRSGTPNGSGTPQRPHLEEVQLKELTAEEGPGEQDGVIYNVLDPPPEYNTLEQIDECSQVSTTAVCNNVAARGSPGSSSGGAIHHSSGSIQHSPHSSHHSQENHPRSATLPGGHSHSSPRSSRTSSLSSSTHSPPTSRSLQVGRVPAGHTISNSSTGSRGSSGSPQVTCSGKLNRLSGHSEGNDRESDFSDRSAKESLV